MPFEPGAELGSYRILSPLGAGGMGAVYRASDTRLRRDVAIKILPEAFGQDPERLARFEREARVLASLNHPNIATLHGLEEAASVRFLVMELVPGETLARRIARGAIPLAEALPLFRQVAEALEAAHEKGVVHRDLKPANLMVTPEGQVKVLDFGLAKALSPQEPEAVDLSHSPTRIRNGTEAGVILGTASYMSPEQARGRPADKRTDVWAFGCVFYEALTGRKAFPGDTLSDTIARILDAEPRWEVLPRGTPESLRRLLRRCLEKDLHRRLRHVDPAELEIEPTRAAGGRPAWASGFRWAAVILISALAAGITVWNLKPPPARPVIRLTLALGPGERLMGLDRPAVAISPDGSMLAYVATRGGPERLFLRAIDEFESRPVTGSEGAGTPFFSPDGKWVGFSAEAKLKKVPASGGTPVTLSSASPVAQGASWGDHDTIVFNPSPNGGLMQVPASGGPRQALVPPDPAGEARPRWPEILPGSEALLYTLWRLGEVQTVVESLETHERRLLIEGAQQARYLPTGHLVYAQANALYAVRFDLERLQVKGAPVQVVDGVLQNTFTGASQFAISRTGSLVYVPGGQVGEAERALVWVDRKGKTAPLPAPRRPYQVPRLTPDGSRVVVEIAEGGHDVWTFDITRSVLNRLTFEGGHHIPALTPDGKRVAFYSDRGGRKLFWKRLDAGAPEEELTSEAGISNPGSWSPDGKVLAFIGPIAAAGEDDIMLLSLEGDRKPRPFFQTPHYEVGVTFSADGNWIAYISNESGRFEVYVRPYPGPGGKYQISTEGGVEPLWAPSGREIFYRNGDRMMSVKVATQPTFAAESPVELFQGWFAFTPGRNPNYDVTSDGQRFLMIQENEPELTRLHLVQEWFSDLKQRVEAGSSRR